MKIQILGGGCPKCQKLAENAEAAIRGNPGCLFLHRPADL